MKFICYHYRRLYKDFIIYFEKLCLYLSLIFAIYDWIRYDDKSFKIKFMDHWLKFTIWTLILRIMIFLGLKILSSHSSSSQLELFMILFLTIFFSNVIPLFQFVYNVYPVIAALLLSGLLQHSDYCNNLSPNSFLLVFSRFFQ